MPQNHPKFEICLLQVLLWGTMVFDNPYLRKFLGLGGVIRRFFSSYKTSPTININKSQNFLKNTTNASSLMNMVWEQNRSLNKNTKSFNYPINDFEILGHVDSTFNRKTHEPHGMPCSNETPPRSMVLVQIFSGRSGCWKLGCLDDAIPNSMLQFQLPGKIIKKTATIHEGDPP